MVLLFTPTLSLSYKGLYYGILSSAMLPFFKNKMGIDGTQFMFLSCFSFILPYAASFLDVANRTYTYHRSAVPSLLHGSIHTLDFEGHVTYAHSFLSPKYSVPAFSSHINKNFHSRICFYRL